MIVRILGEGRFEVPDGSMEKINALDSSLEDALESKDEKAFDEVLSSLVEAVRQEGSPVPDDHLAPSKLVLPPEGATMAEVEQLLNGDSLDLALGTARQGG
ncbi:MAG: hypothetical protein M1115_01605 [Actinobacteria bacterium]|nr:hypothetical protein [Actinomycetota bacterium]